MLNRLVFVMLLVAGGLATRAEGAIPNADNPDAFTQRKFIAERLQFNLRTLTQAYQAVGRRDPKWDEPAIQFFDAWSAYVANYDEALSNRIPQLGEAELIAIGQRALDAGCDDPMVQFGICCLLFETNDAENASALLTKSAARILDSGYSHQGKLWLARFAISRLDPDALPEGFAEATDELQLHVLTDPNLGKLDRRILWRMFFAGNLGNLSLDRRQQFCEQLAKLNCDPWLLHMITGSYHVDRGWEGRGTGFAGNVRQEGWNIFAREMAKAREHLEAAHQLYPEFPEAATLMIKVAMGGEHRGGEDFRFWFEEAAKAQFDYGPAYSAVRWALRPRWHGSIQAMLAFGAECAATKRYDTMVPINLSDIVDEVVAEHDGDLSVYSPNIVEALREMAAGYIAEPTAVCWKKWYQSYGAAVLWRGARYKDADEMIATIDGEPDPEACAKLRVTPSRLVGSSRVLAGPAAEQALEAERHASNERFSAAYDAYSKLLATVKGDRIAETFVRARLLEFQWTQQFNKGEWVDLSPAANPAAWGSMQIQTGNWHDDGSGTLVCELEAPAWARMLESMSFGSRYELGVKLEFLEPKSLDRDAMAGVFVGWNNSTSYYGVYAYPGADTVQTFGGRKRLHTINRKIGRNCQLNVRVWDEQLSLEVDGKNAITKTKMAERRGWPGAIFGLTVSSRNGPLKVAIKEFRIRRLNSPIG